MRVEFVDHDVERVIAVETMGMFHRLVQEKAYKKFDALIVGLKGQGCKGNKEVHQEGQRGTQPPGIHL